MSGTPRLRSGFPATPQPTTRNSAKGDRSPGQPNHGSPILPDIASLIPSKSQPNAPLIPTSTVDAPSQRLYVAGFYTALLFWRFYDFYHLTLDESESLWLFMKWVSLDGVFLFGLPGLHIPWLEWSSATMTILFLFHALLDGILMFRIPIPLGSGLVALTKLLYDRELAVSERRVKPAAILNNPSLILGRQIIHILPEGSAVLNPDHIPLCIDTSKGSSLALLPIHINQTNPTSIELTRYDLERGLNESVVITSSQVKRIRRDAEKTHSQNPNDPAVLHFPVKKTGRYRLQKVVDSSNAEVQGRPSEALVVACPAARVKSAGSDRCRGDLSNLFIEVDGIPPLRVKYQKTVNGQDHDVSYQSIQPEDYAAPVGHQQGSGPVVLYREAQMAPTRSYHIRVPLNETLLLTGLWSYSVEEVTDTLGNVVTYTIPADDSEGSKAKTSNTESILVHDRPTLALQGCDVQRPLRIASGERTRLPVKYGSTGKKDISNTQHEIQYIFTPYEQLLSNGEHNHTVSVVESFSARNVQDKPPIQKSGLYTLQSVSTPFCTGEVLEPVSCLLINPPVPSLGITKEEISDKCAGNPVGLRADLDLVGTPPFDLQFMIKRQDQKQHQIRFQRIEGLRGAIEFKPDQAGHYTYTFVEVSDAVYKSVALKGKEMVLEQDVRPSVSAHFVDASPRTRVCIDDQVSFDVRLQGDGPWTLEYEVAHGGKRSMKTTSAESDVYTINTDPLHNGGDYSLALVSVTDRLGCKEVLQQDVKISVRRQKPKVAFGHLEGQRVVRTLEGKHVELPLRLVGEAPWTVDYRSPSGSIHTKKFSAANDFLSVTDPGIYEIVLVNDAFCRGTIDETANFFEVTWISRPHLSVPESSLMKNVSNRYIRQEVCEGEQDSLDVLFNGRPPYDVKYQEHIIPDHGSKSLRNKELNVPLQSAQIKLNTAQAGVYEYVFVELSDYNYDHDPKKYQPITIQQTVNARPSAAFTDSGRSYSFCQGGEGTSSEQSIPITLKGKAPFSLDVEIRHRGRSVEGQTITFPHISSNSYDLRIPHEYLSSGHSTISIRRVRDARGCERILDAVVAPRVQISVHDPPSITSLEPDRTHYCVGDRITFALSGAAPFNVFYVFEGKARKASAQGSTFRRIAETAGNFTITGVQDAASACEGGKGAITKIIHELPSVKVSKGRESRVDIHAGGQADILFEFGGMPPFEFTYTRSENVDGKRSSAKHGAVLETKTLESQERSLRIKASEEGTYEVVAIRDRYCAFARPGAEGFKAGRKGLLQ